MGGLRVSTLPRETVLSGQLNTSTHTFQKLEVSLGEQSRKTMNVRVQTKIIKEGKWMLLCLGTKA